MQAQLARLAELSRQKAENMQSNAENIALAERNEKKGLWIRVQDELPEEAEFLTELGAQFGRLAKVEVTNLATGEFFKLR
jgi:hypothetical protein